VGERVVAILLVAGVSAGLVHRPALSQEPTGLEAGVNRTQGWIGVRVSGPVGAAVTLAEVVRGVAQPFAEGRLTDGTYANGRALASRCDRPTRVLLATVQAPDGTQSQAQTTVVTPSCARRFALHLHPSTAARVGRRLLVAVSDAWRGGTTSARLCLGRECRLVMVGGRTSTDQLRPSHKGLVHVRLRGRGFALRRRLEVRGRHAKLRLLATGDSMIQIIDSDLHARLRGRATVRSDARVSTGISKPFLLDWVRHARRQAAATRPQVTVVFIGANDGFSIGGAPCCDARWIRRYARRAAAMMTAYVRGGAGHVYWLTLPTPRSAAWKPVYHAVNLAIRAAAARSSPDEVSVVDLARVFTPGERYRARLGGRLVRQRDGVHLNAAGAAIAARLLVRRLHADGFT
jgi:lysophospholipase L1-like esterase